MPVCNIRMELNEGDYKVSMDALAGLKSSYKSLQDAAYPLQDRYIRRLGDGAVLLFLFNAALLALAVITVAELFHRPEIACIYAASVVVLFYARRTFRKEHDKTIQMLRDFSDEYYQAVVGEQLLSTSHILWTYLRGFELNAFVFVEADGTHWTADEMVECLKQTTSQGLKFICACVVFGLPKEGEVLEEVRPEKYMQVANPPTPDPSELLN